MRAYKLKPLAQRASLLGAVAALVIATVVPSLALADSLNPLTERSLLLSSSAPGYTDTDGSGNSETNLNANGGYFSPPGSGPNGKKTGETFTFRVSTDSSASGTNEPIQAFTFQYCTEAAGKCQAPGDNTGDARQVYPLSGLPDDPANSDTSLWDGTNAPNDRAANGTIAGKADFEAVLDTAVAGTDYTIEADLNNDGDYLDANENASAGWSLDTSNVESLTHSESLTGLDNYITLSNASSTLQPTANTKIKIEFKASSANYITNPGSGAFFVKLNTYKDDTTLINPTNDPTPEITTDQTVIDGGVTVANVMTDSIHITTKVLETMAFSVGTRNPDTQAIAHGSCDSIQVIDNNRLNLGNPNAEYSLETDTAYDVFSYWRLSSNSSAGATVYYSGNTLSNTVGDEIAPIGAAPGNTIPNDGAFAKSQPGTEQYGLAFVDAADDTTDPEGLDNDSTNDFPENWRDPSVVVALDPLEIVTGYELGSGTISDPVTANNAQFGFKKSSLETPVLIAQNDDTVITCATAKMRYVANIAADTPAGVYTSKVNYLASPQY